MSLMPYPAEPEALCARDHGAGRQPPAGEGGRARLVLQPAAEGEADDAAADRRRRVPPARRARQRRRPARRRGAGPGRGAAPRPPGTLPRPARRPRAAAPPPGGGAPPAPDPARPEPVLAGLTARGAAWAARAAQPAHDVPLAAPPRAALRHPAAAAAAA